MNIYKIGDTFQKRIPEAVAWCNANNCLFVKTAKGYVIQSQATPSLETLKEDKLLELEKAQLEAEDKAFVYSSIGFEINANERAYRDVSGLLITTKEGDVVQFCDLHNELHPVSLSQLKVMQEEIIRNGQAIYAKKWAMRNQIKLAENKEQLDAIVISFEKTESLDDLVYEEINGISNKDIEVLS